LVRIYAKDWIAHDGCWFQGIEKKRGIEEAIELDKWAWEKFTVIEARRMKEFLELGENSGLDGLEKALNFRLQATLTNPEIVREGNTLTLTVRRCRVQYARERKNMEFFPCKPVGIAEHKFFAKEIDSRIEMECISCPPDVRGKDVHCVWKFTLEE